ncbi:MAG TPA: SagB/ThcOx family dehydrogenase [Chloroflexi bacterium]|nr:SagB/ThcOx family dehydrogenase [Chloroflexota bacterium]
MNESNHPIGDTFQRQTKYRRGHLPGGRLDWASKPAPYKHYPSAPTIPLPPPADSGGDAIWDVLKHRRSVRSFQDEPIQARDLSQLLWAAQGITRSTHQVGFRTAPSAGALYPVETYLVVHAVSDVPAGIYHYAIAEHELEQLSAGDYRAQIAQAALDQEIARRANVVFVWTAIFERAKWKYKQRAYRYIYLDAGHIAQNVALGAVALGLGSCQIAALYDDEANALLNVDGVEESVIYMTVVGKPH